MLSDAKCKTWVQLWVSYLIFKEKTNFTIIVKRIVLTTLADEWWINRIKTKVKF